MTYAETSCEIAEITANAAQDWDVWSIEQLSEFCSASLSAVDGVMKHLHASVNEGKSLGVKELHAALNVFRMAQNLSEMAEIQLFKRHHARYGFRFGPARVNALDWNTRTFKSSYIKGEKGLGKCPANTYYCAALPVGVPNLNNPRYDQKDNLVLRMHPRKQYTMKAHRAIDALRIGGIGKVTGGFYLLYEGKWLDFYGATLRIEGAKQWELEGIITKEHLLALAHQGNKVRNFCIERSNTEPSDFRVVPRPEYRSMMKCHQLRMTARWMLKLIVQSAALQFYRPIVVHDQPRMEMHQSEVTKLDDNLELYYGPSPYLTIDASKVSNDMLDATDIGAAAILPDVLYIAKRHALGPDGIPIPWPRTRSFLLEDLQD